MGSVQFDDLGQSLLGLVAVFLNPPFTFREIKHVLTNENVKPQPTFFFFTKCALLILGDPINIIDYGNMLIPLMQIAIT